MKNIHILPTNKDSNLFIGDLSGQLHFNYSIEKGSSQNQHIYITSDEEEIKKGNWYLEEKSKFNPKKLISEAWGDGQHFKTFNQKGFRKIILTTDTDLIADGVQAIEDSFLEWFVKNPSCEEVEVKKGKMKLNDDGEEYGFPDMSLYKIIIPKEEPKTILERLPFPELVKEFAEYYKNVPLVEEPKQETLEEAAERLYPFAFGGIGNAENDKKNHFIKGAKWQQEQFKNESTADYIDRHIVEALVETAKKERRYSEEEVKSILKSFVEDTRGDKSWVDADDEWFEQFKKK